MPQELISLCAVLALLALAAVLALGTNPKNGKGVLGRDRENS